MNPHNQRQPESLRLVTSEDGSHTLYVPGLNEHYHSVHGAIREAGHIFIDAGFRKINENNKSVQLLEVGFGTGLNALLTCLLAEEAAQEVNYTGIEAFPLMPKTTEQLNYTDIPDAAGIFRRICYSDWEKAARISKRFNLTKINCRIQDFTYENGPFNLVYFDAFSPDVQPEMWDSEVFMKLYENMEKGGLLLTYSCKGIVKRAMKSAGFTLEKLPGPPGKREFLRATKPG
jgi:tRNA U34 5-methylaminomethyl-2-thiouridine-forming methyltransferase MnmC